MESKQLWTIVGISLVVALAVTLVSGAVSSGPLFSPKTSANAYVKANSCDADGSCEMNDAVVGGDLEYVGNLIGLDCEVLPVNQGGGVPTCENAGYSICVAEEYESFVKYFDSNGTGCDGNVQLDISDYRLMTCTNGGGGGGFGCARSNQGVEPYYGDAELGSRPTDNAQVLCCR